MSNKNFTWTQLLRRQESKALGNLTSHTLFVRSALGILLIGGSTVRASRSHYGQDLTSTLAYKEKSHQIEKFFGKKQYPAHSIQDHCIQSAKRKAWEIELSQRSHPMIFACGTLVRSEGEDARNIHGDLICVLLYEEQVIDSNASRSAHAHRDSSEIQVSTSAFDRTTGHVASYDSGDYHFDLDTAHSNYLNSSFNPYALTATLSIVSTSTRPELVPPYGSKTFKCKNVPLH